MFFSRPFLYFTLFLGLLLPLLISADSDVNECANATLNNCSPNANCTNTNGSYTCTCKSGYHGNGTTCNDVNECANSTLNNCSPNANCTNTNGSHTCTCKSGYDGNGLTCNDVNECTNSTLNNCSPNANCTNTNGSHTCTCKSGYDGNGLTCNDVNECANSTLNNCSPNANCTNTNGSYTCTCKSGFQGNGMTCNDVNECANSTLNNCSPNANCTNTNGSYTCTCKSGFQGNGMTCNDVNECANSTLNNCSPNANCTNTNGSYTCTCKSGFQGNGMTCNDVNECANSTLNNCSPNANCTNTNGSYTCTCKSGFLGNGMTCNDVNECANSTLNNCSPNANCTNTNGSYTCTCKSGYDGNGMTCNDVNECANSTLNNCSPNANCTNTNGSYVCECKSGFLGNGMTCNDINECANSTLNNCSPNATCTNTNGSHTCECNSGYEGDGMTCNNINECAISTLNNCSLNANCSDTNGSYTCTCKSGYDGNGMTCIDKNECFFAVCKREEICNNTEGSFQCMCKDGYQRNGSLCEDINECQSGSATCGKNSVCENVKGSYNCPCKKRYRLYEKQCEEITMFPYSKAIDTTKQDIMYGPYDMYGDIHAFGYFFSTVYVSQNGYISLGSDPEIRALPMANHSFPKNVVIFAPFWAELDLSAKGKIYVDDYKSCKPNDVLSDIGKSLGNFDAKRALVITWENVSPYPSTEFGNETITFQAVLVSNETQFYVMFNYDKEKIHLNEEANERTILIGDLDGKKQFTDVTSGRNVYDWVKEPTNGFVGRRFSKLIGESTESSMVCLDWFCENEGKTLANAAIAQCPCTKKQAELDYTFKLNQGGCFEPSFARGDIMQTCCYTPNGALLRGYPGGGNTYNKSADISIGRKHCCTDYKLCNLFYEIYPSNNCSGYQIPKEVLIWNPLVFNFVSGKSVIFYGSGEYNLIKTASLTLQARIEMKKNAVTPAILSDLPVYTAFAIKYDKEKVVFTVAGSSISVNPASTPNIKVEDISGVKLVRTPLIQMKVMLTGDGIGVALFVPASESSTSLGLISEPLQNATTFEAWKLSSQNESLFTYSASENFTTINSNKVDPKTFKEIDANLTKLLQDNMNKSTGLCGKSERHCQLQLLLEKNTTIQNAEKQEVVNQETLGNFPPVFENVSPAILVYKNILKEVQAKDPENNNVTISLETQLKQNTYQFENNKFNWTLNSTNLPNPSFVKFFASDPSNAVSLYWPEIFLCMCRDKSECQESSMNNKRRLRFLGNNEIFNSSEEARMYRLPCDCNKGYTGRYCEETVDRCTPTTCYQNVVCNASKSGNPCGPCPSGMAGDGVKCYDINQCSKGVCTQNCKDLLGNDYICSCRSGYVLAADNKTCTDINECDGENNCTKDGQYCANNDGSYSCKCKLGYIEQENGCLSLKGKTKLGGSLEFIATPDTPRAWSDDLKDTSSQKFKKLANLMEASLRQVLPKVDLLEVNSFEKVDSQQKRKKRDTSPVTSPVTIKGNYEVIGTNVNAKDIENSLKNKCQGTYCKIGNFEGIAAKSITVAAAPLCPSSSCDPISTDCVEKNGFECICKPGFDKVASDKNRCKDIDECSTKPCGSANCTNKIGTYDCVCEFGFVFNNGTKKCDDVCGNNVCKEGICTRNAYTFRCSCKNGWTGEKCDQKDSENEQMKTNLIIVGAVLGSLCLIFILIIVIMCCRAKSRKSDDLPQFYDSDTPWRGLPRARLREVEMNENGSRLDLTKNSNTYESLPGMLNPAFDPGESRVDRC